MLGCEIAIYRDRLLREVHTSTIIANITIRRNIRLTLIKCEAALRASSVTGVMPQHCLTILENPFDRSWAHDVDIDTLKLVCARFENYLDANRNYFDDYNEVQQTLNATMAEILDVEAFFVSRTGKDLDTLNINIKDFEALVDVMVSEGSHVKHVYDIGDYLDAVVEEEEEIDDQVVLTAKEINKTLAKQFDGTDFISDLLVCGVCDIDRNFSFIEAPNYTMKSLEQLRKIAIKRQNIANLSIAKLGADFKAANGVNNVKITDSLPFPDALDDGGGSSSFLKDNIEKFDKILDSRVYLHLLDYFNID
jgi:hypothetical protein